MLNKKDIDLLIDEMERVFVTKDEYSKGQDKVLTKLDGIAKRVAKTDDEQQIVKARVSDHENRIEKMEENYESGPVVGV